MKLNTFAIPPRHVNSKHGCCHTYLVVCTTSSSKWFQLVIFWIVEDRYLLPYLPKQLLKWLVSTEGDSERGWM